MGLGTQIRQHVAAPALVTAALDWSRGWSRRWGERAQEQARRNAMVATNELLARRMEREDVETFLRLADRPVLLHSAR